MPVTVRVCTSPNEKSIIMVVPPALGFAEEATEIAQLSVRSGLGDWAGFTRCHGKIRFETIGASDPLVGHLNRKQYELLEGPSVDAVGDGRAVLVADISVELRWPEWTRAARLLGVSSVLTIGLSWQAEVNGAFTVFSAHNRDYDAADVALATLIATRVILGPREVSGPRPCNFAVHSSNQLIGLTQGIVSQQHSVSIGRSSELLAIAAARQGLTLAALAHRIVHNMNASPPKGSTEQMIVKF